MKIVTGPIVGLDLATATGWAVGKPHEEPRFGTNVLPSTGEDIGKFGDAFDAWMSALMSRETPAAVLYEQPSVFSATTPATAIKLNGLAYDAEKICRRFHVPVFRANPSRLKKFFTGRGNAKKPEMIAAARARGWNVTDDNQADACAVWAWGVLCYGPREHSARFELGHFGGAK